ncbi:MAG: hypothetical protein Q8L74_08860 [Nitrospirota bacterium]|nr:hypothetical protein [Nitrospirota bacterium]MDP2382057.1 hypothetical protein [Nitrospirota bacterium]MDP3599488.1 hypothetical protein [Nitrospirota bacterium]
MLRTDTLESAIRQVLAQVGICTLEELSERLPSFSWNQLFAAVDRLTRDGIVTLQRPGSSGYLVSLAPNRPVEARETR